VTDLHRPSEAEIVERRQESPTIFTLRLRFTDDMRHAAYRFAPGQFNMLYLYGVGEIPISIVSDPEDETVFDHAIRAIGRVTHAMSHLHAGDRLGVRGPFGRGWPMADAEGKDVVIVTGGLGCAPVVSVINYMMRRRDRFGRIVIVQGVKHADDLIWRRQYEDWQKVPNTQVLVAADQGARLWPWHVGRVTELFDAMHIVPDRSIAMLCGPEPMMRVTIEHLLGRGLAPAAIHLSMERNMQCAVGLCGHCQYGHLFVCRDGPVFGYPEVAPYFGIRGY